MGQSYHAFYLARGLKKTTNSLRRFVIGSLSLGCNEKGVYKAGHLIFIVQCKFLECSFLSKLNRLRL